MLSTLGLGLDQLVDVLKRLESQAIRVYPQQCSKLRHRRSSCTLCADYCPVQAIAWGDTLQVDPDKCNGCGMCAAVCPTGALEAQAPTNLELLAQIQELVKPGAAIAFACQRYLEAGNGDGDGFIPVHCLGRLDESILVGAVSLGAEAVWLMDGACQECPYSGRIRGSGVVAAQAVQRANKLLEAFGIAQHIFIGPELPDGLSTAAGPPTTSETLSRRAFFSMLAHRTSGAAGIAATATLDSMLGSRSEGTQRPKKGELPVHLPAKRRLLLAALRRIGKPVVAGFEADDEPFDLAPFDLAPFDLAQGRLWAQFGFNEACTGCQMCAFFCPTGALSKIEEGGKAGVAFRISHCTDCRLCEEICYREAVVLSSAVDLSKVFDDAADVLLMREVEATPWPASPEEKVRSLLESLHPKNE